MNVNLIYVQHVNHWKKMKNFNRNHARYEKAIDTTRGELNKLVDKAVNDYIEENGNDINAGDTFRMKVPGSSYYEDMVVKYVKGKMAVVEITSNWSDLKGQQFNVRLSTIRKANDSTVRKNVRNKVWNDLNKED